jgi:hypothetical protein
MGCPRAGLSASGSRCMRGLQQGGPTEFWRGQGGRCFLINVDLLTARGSPRVALEDNLHVRTFCGSRLSSRMFLAFLFAAIGAIVAEILKRWQQWIDMSEKRFLALLRA